MIGGSGSVILYTSLHDNMISYVIGMIAIRTVFRDEIIRQIHTVE
jgi:hypothetical protein